MIKIIYFLIFLALFIFVAFTKVWQFALLWMWDFVTWFYDNVLVYGNAQIYTIFAIFMFIVGYAVIKH